MSDVQKQIANLLTQRAQLLADIDGQLAKLQEQAVKELEAARANVAALEAVLRPIPRHMPVEHPVSVAQPIDETDAGRGVRETQDNMSADDFKDELAALRERTQEKRRRLA